MPIPPDWRLNMVLWAAVWGALVAWQVATARRDDMPSFADVVRICRRPLVLRWVLLAFWVWLGWHLFVRTHI
jgi:hypothetical protein